MREKDGAKTGGDRKGICGTGGGIFFNLGG
jgi:hypothetical protein